jgi:hypothetical protein
MMGPNKPRPPIEGMIQDIKDGKHPHLVPDESREEQILREKIKALDGKLALAKADIQSILDSLKPVVPGNVFYVNALQVLEKAIDDVPEAKLKSPNL